MTSRMVLSLLAVVFLSHSLTACNGEEERYEDLKKLRTIGVAAFPVFGTPSTETAPQVVTLTIYASLPVGDVATAEPYVDPASKYALNLPVTIVPNSEAYEEHGSFHIYSVKATQVMPTTDLVKIPPKPGYLSVRYGVKITSGKEVENVVGNVLVYPNGAPELDHVAPVVDIAKPSPSAGVSGTEDLEAAITDPSGENMRVGWFVGKGKVKNRRARVTKWETEGSGVQSLLVTIRGAKSGAFAFKAVDVNVQ